MKKIKWKRYGPTGDMSAQVGSVYLNCWQFKKAKTVDCRATVSICRISSTKRYGPLRKSMAKAKEDAVRLARELMEDYQMAVDKEMKVLQGMEN